jgi:predicted nucleic acid-binding protein
MPRVFVDTAAWIALINVDDVLHAPAKQVMKTLRQAKTPLVTTEFVLLEVADALSAPKFRTKVVTFLNGLRQLSVLKIIPASSSLLAEGWKFYSQRPDKEWSLTDCISFVAMRQEQASQAFTSDRHFEQAGFVKLLQ